MVDENDIHGQSVKRPINDMNKFKECHGQSSIRPINDINKFRELKFTWSINE